MSSIRAARVLLATIAVLSLQACTPTPDATDAADAASDAATAPFACGSTTCDPGQVCVSDPGGGGTDSGMPGPTPTYRCAARDPACATTCSRSCYCGPISAGCWMRDENNVVCMYN